MFQIRVQLKTSLKRLL